MYWRLLTSNPTAAKDVVLSDKPVISTETDRMDKGMLDQVSGNHTLALVNNSLIQVSAPVADRNLGSIYHKNPNVSYRDRDVWVNQLNLLIQTFIRTAQAKYLPDSPALNASSKRHRITPQGMGVFRAAATAPVIPQRQSVSSPQSRIVFYGLPTRANETKYDFVGRYRTATIGVCKWFWLSRRRGRSVWSTR